MKQFWIGLRVFLWFTLITGVIYPLAITGISSLFMFDKSSGSIIVRDGKRVGSKLIAQSFTEEKYFRGRPSANDYDPLQSGGSNLAPSSLSLQEKVQKRLSAFPGKNIGEVPSELLFASGSGLDPDISLQTAFFQIDSIAKARGIDSEQGRTLLKQLIDDTATHGYVNVLELNLALDEKVKK